MSLTAVVFFRSGDGTRARKYLLCLHEMLVWSPAWPESTIASPHSQECFLRERKVSLTGCVFFWSLTSKVPRKYLLAFQIGRLLRVIHCPRGNNGSPHFTFAGDRPIPSWADTYVDRIVSCGKRWPACPLNNTCCLLFWRLKMI